MKTCKVCSNPLGYHKSAYCSKPCFKIGKKAIMRGRYERTRPPPSTGPSAQLICDCCRAQFIGYLHMKFCSAACSRRFHAKLQRFRKVSTKSIIPQRTCKCCAKEFRPRIALKTRVFCSEKCQRKFARKGKVQSESKKARRRARYAADPAYRQKMRQKSAASISARLKTDPVLRIKMGLRRRVRKLLSSKPSESISGLVGCSKTHLRAHLQSLFTKGMAWNNYGTFWVVDHKIPLAKFDLQNPEHRQIACHFTNLQPLTAAANSAKADLIIDGQLALRISPRSGVNEPARTASDNPVPCSASG